MTLRAHQVSLNRAGRRLLDRVDLSVAPGELVAVLGPNGAGKSTLLKVLAGDIEPESGVVALGEQPLARIALEDQARLRAVVGQAPVVAFDYSVRDIIEMGWLEHGAGEQHRNIVIREVMTALGIDGLTERTYSTLSGGEQQRAVYARALLQVWRRDPAAPPRWLLLDEPTANLDVAFALTLLRSMREQAQAGLGVLVVLHDLNLAARFADRLVLLENGRVAADGPPEEVLDAGLLSDIYQTPVHVEHNEALDRIVVLT
jgi:iron complex transport system ATP-binding protein